MFPVASSPSYKVNFFGIPSFIIPLFDNTKRVRIWISINLYLYIILILIPLIISIYFSITNSSTGSSISQPQPQQYFKVKLCYAMFWRF